MPQYLRDDPLPEDPVSCQAEPCPACDQVEGVELTSSTARVQAWHCTRCCTSWAVSVVNPNVGAALAVIGLLPTPQQRTAALLDVMRAEVTRRSEKEHHPMADTVSFPVTELVNIDAMASVATTVWWCRLCEHEATAASRPAAHSDAVAHLVGEHRATIGTAP